MPPENTLPLDTDLPPEVCDRSAWYGAELVQRTDWVELLSEAEIAEVESAVHQLETSTIDVAAFTAKDVPLPTLGPRLQQLLDEVLNGRGFVLIKSLPVDRWTKQKAAIAFLVIGVHLGRLRMQNAVERLVG